MEQMKMPCMLCGGTTEHAASCRFFVCRDCGRSGIQPDHATGCPERELLWGEGSYDAIHTLGSKR